MTVVGRDADRGAEAVREIGRRARFLEADLTSIREVEELGDRIAAEGPPHLLVNKHLTDYPWLSEPAEHLSKGPRVTADTFMETVTEPYNAAQLDVLGRASVLAREQVAASSAAPDTAALGEEARGEDTPATAAPDEGENR